MIRTMMAITALAVTSVGFAGTGNAQGLTEDQAYCRKLVDEYTLGGMGRGALPQGVATSVAIEQCRSGNPEPAIPVLQQQLRRDGFDVPSRT